MILLEASRAREGFVSVKAWRAVFTRCAGSFMKCLTDILVGVYRYDVNKYKKMLIK